MQNVAIKSPKKSPKKKSPQKRMRKSPRKSHRNSPRKSPRKSPKKSPKKIARSSQKLVKQMPVVIDNKNVIKNTSTDHHNLDSLNWRLVQSDLDRTLQDTKNIFSKSSSAKILQNNVNPSNDIHSHFGADWHNQLKWNFDFITNNGISKWSKKVFNLEKLSQTERMNVLIQSNAKYIDAKNNYVSNNRFNHLYGDALLRNIMKKQPKIGQYKQSKLHIVLTNLYYELIKSNKSQITEDEFVHICLKWIASKYKFNSDYLHYLQYEYLPKIWKIMILFQQNIINSSSKSKINISKSNFIRHFEIMLTQNNFINACKRYCNYLKNIKSQKQLPFNPDILRLSAVIISKINFEKRVLPYCVSPRNYKKTQNKYEQLEIRTQTQTVSKKKIRPNTANAYFTFDNDHSVFQRLHDSGMKQKVRRKDQFELGKLVIDDQCTFKPRISPFAQKKAKMRKRPQTAQISTKQAAQSYSQMFINIKTKR